MPYSRAFVNHRGREQYRHPRGQGSKRGAGQVLEPAQSEFIRSVGGLVSGCGAMGGGEIWSRNVHRQRQKEREDGKGDRQSTARIIMTDRDTDR